MDGRESPLGFADIRDHWGGYVPVWQESRPDGAAGGGAGADDRAVFHSQCDRDGGRELRDDGAAVDYSRKLGFKSFGLRHSFVIPSFVIRHCPLPSAGPDATSTFN